MDDHSRKITALDFTKTKSSKEISATVKKGIKKNGAPDEALIDNAKELKFSNFKLLLNKKGIKPIYSHPYYPQDKGKIERMIKTLIRELLNVIKPKNGKELKKAAKEFLEFYNSKRFHEGIKGIPDEQFYSKV